MHKATGLLLGMAIGMALAPAASCQAGNPSRAFQIVTSNLPLPAAGQRYQFQLRAAGGRPPYRWSLPAAPLPGGLRLDPASGLISGIPQASDGFSVLVAVSD